MSATLGASARAEFLHPAEARPTVDTNQQAINRPYPAVSFGQGDIEPIPPISENGKCVRIEPVTTLEFPETLLPRLAESVRSGQRVLVVLNTVSRVIALARAAEEADPELARFLFTCRGLRCPHHGRFARPDREILDQEVSLRLGKDSPDGAVLLIGTQTLEQSLDIDADWLVTDLCPVDVLLQRIGRLHRHNRGLRPTAQCTVMLPEKEDMSEYLNKKGEVTSGVPAGLGLVYEDLRILQLTRDLVQAAPLIEIPRDNRRLVESATNPERLATLHGHLWDAHAQRLEGLYGAQESAAHNALIPGEHFGDFLFPDGLEPRLATRLGLNDRRLSLGGNFLSPFGQTIDSVDIPGHLARGLDQEEADSVEPVDGLLTIRAGSLTFNYSRYGLEKKT